MFNEFYYAPPLEPPEGYYFETREQERERLYLESLGQEQEEEE